MHQPIHSPTEWVLLQGSEGPLLLISLCSCENSECSYVADVNFAVNTNLNPKGTVRI